MLQLWYTLYYLKSISFYRKNVSNINILLFSAIAMRYLLVSYRDFSKKHKRIKQCARAPQNTIHSPQYPLTNIFMLLINFIPLKISKNSFPFIFVGTILSLCVLCTGNRQNNISWITYTMDFYIFKNFSDSLSHMFDKPTKFI